MTDDRELVQSDQKFEMKRAMEPVDLCAVRAADTGELVSGYRGIRHTRTGRVVSIVSDHYNLLPNTTAIMPILKELKRLGHVYNVGRLSYITDQRVRLQLEFPHLRIKDDTDEGAISSIFINNSYNMTESFRLTAGAMRMVCSNGLVIGTILKKVKVTHQAEDIVDFAIVNVEEAMGLLESGVKEVEKEISEMRQTPITAQHVHKWTKHLDVRVLANTLRDMGWMDDEDKNSAARDLLEDMSESQARTALDDGRYKNMWHVYCELTRFISHEIPQRYRVDYLERLARGVGHA